MGTAWAHSVRAHHASARGLRACSCHDNLQNLYTLRSLLRPLSATDTVLSVLSVFSLHVRLKFAIAHANNLAFYILFTWAPVNFTWAQPWVCPGVAMPLILGCR